jgi:hypothetical protein
MSGTGELMSVAPIPPEYRASGLLLQVMSLPSPAASKIGHAIRVEGDCKALNVINVAGARKTNEPPTHMMAAPRT